ncbi:Cupin domain protein [Tranquillimonas rosea]|uniref:Cupin domain protein n=1 Tax=Tranquillimonas rosea TaxID=641238 RepID=A0A1H9VEP2_9RHOB|nr:cupin domain-containing protein [Tranquillimonas rosea]SES20021.1 Cupin domain protein [Tranquillimonas rosea]
MPQPFHVPAEAPEVKVMQEAQRGGLKYRLMVDASGGPSGEVCQGYFYLYDGHTESMHRHDVTETISVVEGTGTAWLGAREITMRPGDSLFIPAGHMHGFAADEDMTLFFTFPTESFDQVGYEYGEAA